MVEKKASSRKNSNGSSLFTAEDDQKLVEGYRKYGNNWKDISKEYFNGRFKTNQLFQRYKRVLVAKDKESTWSKNEDIELLAVYHHLDGSWVQMSKKYYKDTRTDNQLSNRWASLKKSCCLIDTFAKLKPNIKKDLYTLYKKVRKASGADMIKFTNYNEIVEIPEDAFPKIYLGEGRKVQKEGAKKRKTATKKESSGSCDESSTTKKRKTTTSTYVEEDSTSTSSSSSDEEDEVSVDDVPVLPRVIPTRGQRVNYSKMLSDCEEEAIEEEETKQSSPESEDEEDVQPQTQLSKQQVQWLQAQKCPAKRSSSSTAPSLCNFDLACDEELDVAQQQQIQQPQPQPQTQQTVQRVALPVVTCCASQQPKQIQYTVMDNHDFNLNFNEEECLEIERFLGAPYSNYEQERNYSMEDIVAQTRIIKEYLEQTRACNVTSARQEEEQNPFLSLSDDFCETNDLELFDFSTFSRTAPKSPSLFDDLDF